LKPPTPSQIVVWPKVQSPLEAPFYLVFEVEGVGSCAKSKGRGGFTAYENGPKCTVQISPRGILWRWIQSSRSKQ